MKRNTALTSTFTNGFDIDGTLTAQSPSRAHRDPLRRVGRGVLVAIGITLFTPAYADAPDEAKSFITAKEYAALRLDNTQQYKCLATLYGKESAFNRLAIGNINGSMQTYGIPQLKNPIIKDLSPNRQIDYGMKYVKHRYSTPCRAWAHWVKKGWH